MRPLYDTTVKCRKNRNVLEGGAIVIPTQGARRTDRKARYYQVEAYQAFEPCFSSPETPNCFLIAPTASGKSLIMIMMAKGWIDRGRKVVFVVPQNSIKGGFVSQSFWHEGNLVQWDRPMNLPGQDEQLSDDTTREVTGLLDFLDAPDYPGEQSWICTYQTLFAALDSGGPTAFANTAVIMDEAHHLSSEGEDLSLKRNRGGIALSTLLRHGIPHMLCTATPYRADGNSILPQIAQSRYLQYTRQRADHLADFSHVEGYRTHVAVGDVMELLEQRLREAKAAGHKALVALPHVNSRHAHRFARQLRVKYDRRDTKLLFENTILDLCEKLGLSCASVVRDESFQRNDAKLRAAFIKLARDDSTVDDLAAIPDVTLVQERYKEGTDCVAWSVCIQIGLSASCVFLAQFPGRVLRDHWSKAGHVVEFHTLMPDYDTADQDEKAEWTLDAVKSLLVLSFMDMDLKRRQFVFSSELNTHRVPREAPRLSEAKLDASIAPSLDVTFGPATRAASIDGEVVQPSDVIGAFDRYFGGSATPRDLSLLDGTFSGLLEASPQALEQFAPRIPINSSCLSDDDIRFRRVTDKLVAFASVVGRYEAKAFRDRLAQQSPRNRDLEIEHQYVAQKCSPSVVAAEWQTPLPHVVNHLLSRGVLHPRHAMRVKPVKKRKRIPGTI